MSLESEIKAKLGGFWNSFLLLLIVIICLRFSSIELADGGLAERVTCAFYLFASCIGAGVFAGMIKLLLSFSTEPYARAPKSTSFALGMKYGIVAAGMLVFIVGFVQLENFLGPFQVIVDSLYGKLPGLIT